ncbi:hypothetical protein CkaCkLH20_10023 [Colletotrichum karsti]|uniref:Uncharacterized protein n=1 Tax=Colletotrichum karsti TaxID=1095194 RepID=A0A9P6I1X7_9PEZI|nr:uncharacterized protein CkaCkLH20_10023 [Colletotrichum karsti]KAF9872526.1 hypothetical protein CkaCkLH20_10023 [Colletotrichum karsti]
MALVSKMAPMAPMAATIPATNDYPAPAVTTNTTATKKRKQSSDTSGNEDTTKSRKRTRLTSPCYCYTKAPKKNETNPVTPPRQKKQIEKLPVNYPFATTDEQIDLWTPEEIEEREEALLERRKEFEESLAAQYDTSDDESPEEDTSEDQIPFEEHARMYYAVPEKDRVYLYDVLFNKSYLKRSGRESS